MERIITPENLSYFAHLNDKICAKPIRGVVLSFRGLGDGAMLRDDTELGVYFAERGILCVIPYCNPWAWMNRDAVDFVDEVVDVILEKFRLPDDVPIVSSGGSMGGLASLTYAAYAKRTPVACVSNCPVCDLVYHYGERRDLPRTLYSAFHGYDGTLEEALKTASPLHLAERMPDIPYHIFHCDADEMVDLEQHSGRFVAELKRLSRDVTLYVAQGRGHCNLTDELRDLYRQLCADAVETRRA